MIIGWNRIVPQLAVFFALLKRRKKLTPYNLFIYGGTGTNKSEGMLELGEHLGLSTGIVDTSTLDDASEIAGVVNHHANREFGKFEIIEGELLGKQILILDEFLNCRGHVLPQFRLVLQGYLMICAHQMQMHNKCIIAAGNLSSDIFQGDVMQLDAPTADRFAMVVRAPNLDEMQADERAAILEERSHCGFIDAFDAAVKSIEEHYETTTVGRGLDATRYVDTLLTGLSNKDNELSQSDPKTKAALKVYKFNGRRGILLRKFVLGAMALCKAQPEHDLGQTIFTVVESCLSYHKLCGVAGAPALLKAAHEVAFQVINNDSIDAVIAAEPELATKLQLVLDNLSVVNSVTMAGVVGAVLGSDDDALRIAALELARSRRLDKAPREMKGLLERITVKRPSAPVGAEPLLKFSRMSQAEIAAYQACQGDEQSCQTLLHRVYQLLEQWGVPVRAQGKPLIDSMVAGELHAL